MNIRRPEERSGGRSISEQQALALALSAKEERESPSSRDGMRGFYRQAPWGFTEVFQVKIGATG